MSKELVNSIKKYRRWYLKIINTAKSENRKRGDRYYESHHILPKSLYPLWSNKQSNQVLLTAREHFVCHLLLTQIFPSYQMNLAYCRLALDGRRKISSRDYERAKKLLSDSESNAEWKCSKVICLNTMEIFDSINLAEDKYNKSKSRKRYIGKACKNHTWAFKLNGKPLFWEFYNDHTDYNKLYLIRLKEYEDTLQKLRKIKRINAIKQHSNTTNEYKHFHKIMCVETKETFENISSAIRKYNCSGIKRAVDKNKISAGYHWVSVN